MDPEVLGDLVAPERRSEALAYRRADDRARSHTYESFCATAWKTANLLRLYGVHAGTTVGIVDAPKRPDGQPPTDPTRQATTPIPEVLLSFVGAGTLGANVQFDPAPPFDGGALLCPAAWSEAYETSAGCTTLAYGGPPTDPEVVHFESEFWSETPIAPPESVSPDAALVTTAREYTHEELLGAAQTFIEDVELEAGDAISIDARLGHPGTIAGGVVAPLVVGGTIHVGGNDVAVRIGDNGVDPDRIIQDDSDERDSPT
ncbi:hypothetical protein Hrd1104_04775 [Halorhabdus sp. CBA1104]|uniref:hypothetical protein n=1 Tax=Halorhabdus sp. CBA1104 TaxID=1380432 RepID=UPI0012B2F9DB|nr:hypothetical protein [Halorhabdus sp. CBA1104]QGN06675.1 hypothetical protein Hrd1104_04775 [Halorhabdus sp. CBA1104]